MEVQNITDKETGYTDSENILGLLIRSHGIFIEKCSNEHKRHWNKFKEYKDMKAYYNMLYSILAPEYDMGNLPNRLDNNIEKTEICYYSILKIARNAGIYTVGQKESPVVTKKKIS